MTRGRGWPRRLAAVLCSEVVRPARRCPVLAGASRPDAGWRFLTVLADARPGRPRAEGPPPGRLLTGSPIPRVPGPSPLPSEVTSLVFSLPQNSAVPGGYPVSPRMPGGATPGPVTSAGQGGGRPHQSALPSLPWLRVVGENKPRPQPGATRSSVHTTLT